MILCVFNVLVHCGKYTSSFRDDGCTYHPSDYVANVYDCWAECISDHSQNMIWNPNGVDWDRCGCVDESIDPSICEDGQYEYYNTNPAYCIPGNSFRNIPCNFMDNRIANKMSKITLVIFL